MNLCIFPSNMGQVVMISKDIETNLYDVAIRKQLVQYLPSRLRKHSDSIVGSADNKGSSILRQELANIVSPAAKSQSTARQGSRSRPVEATRHCATTCFMARHPGQHLERHASRRPHPPCLDGNHKCANRQK